MRIVPGRDSDERTQIFNDRNTVIGYVENETLYGIGKDGYADAIGSIQSTAEIIPKLSEWRKTH